MKNTKLFWGMLVIVLAFGITFAGCPVDPSDARYPYPQVIMLDVGEPEWGTSYPPDPLRGSVNIYFRPVEQDPPAGIEYVGNPPTFTTDVLNDWLTLTAINADDSDNSRTVNFTSRSSTYYGPDSAYARFSINRSAEPPAGDPEAEARISIDMPSGFVTSFDKFVWGQDKLKY